MLRVESSGQVASAMPVRDSLRAIGRRLTIAGELLQSAGLSPDVVTGYRLGRRVYAYPRPRGVPPLRTGWGCLRLRGEVSRSGGGSLFLWRICKPRFGVFGEYEAKELDPLRGWLEVVQRDLSGA